GLSRRARARAPSGRGRPRRPSLRGPLGPAGRRFDFLDRVAEVGNVLERPVHGREADVADLVELPQLVHHELADLPRRDLALTERQHLLDDALDRRVDVLGRHRSLVQRALEADADLALVEVGARAVALDDLRQAELDVLVGREALLARHAASAAPY